jgi:hypothetical protein
MEAIETYPTKFDIQNHKDNLWKIFISKFKDSTMDNKTGMTTDDITNALRAMAGDAALWVYNNENKSKTLDMAKIGKFILTIKVTSETV